MLSEMTLVYVETLFKHSGSLFQITGSLHSGNKILRLLNLSGVKRYCHLPETHCSPLAFQVACSRGVEDGVSEESRQQEKEQSFICMLNHVPQNMA